MFYDDGDNDDNFRIPLIINQLDQTILGVRARVSDTITWDFHTCPSFGPRAAFLMLKFHSCTYGLFSSASGKETVPGKEVRLYTQLAIYGYG